MGRTVYWRPGSWELGLELSGTYASPSPLSHLPVRHECGGSASSVYSAPVCAPCICDPGLGSWASNFPGRMPRLPPLPIFPCVTNVVAVRVPCILRLCAHRSFATRVLGVGPRTFRDVCLAFPPSPSSRASRMWWQCEFRVFCACVRPVHLRPGSWELGLELSGTCASPSPLPHLPVRHECGGSASSVYSAPVCAPCICDPGHLRTARTSLGSWA